MLMEDRQIALNDVLVALQEAADNYRDAVELVEDATLAGLFEQLAGKRDTMVSELREHVVRLGTLPREPDADSEQAHRLISRFKVRLSPNERLTVIDERLDAEAHIAELIDAALQHDLPESTLRLLQKARSSAEEARSRLSEAKSGL